jgi:hypothetical protein
MDYGVLPALWMRNQAVMQSNKALQLTNPLRGLCAAELGR